MANVDPNDWDEVELTQNAVRLYGQRFTKLVALRPVGKRGQGIKWLCECDCGNHITAAAAHLKAKRVKSCGCLKRTATAKSRTTADTTVNWAELVGTAGAVQTQTPPPPKKKKVSAAERRKRVKEEHHERMQNDDPYREAYLAKEMKRSHMYEARRIQRIQQQEAEHLEYDLKKQMALASQLDAFHAAIAAEEKYSLEDWAASRFGGRYDNPSVKEAIELLIALRENGPGYEEMIQLNNDWILANEDVPQPEPPRWYAAVTELSREELTWEDHVAWMMDFDYYTYSTEELAYD